MNRCPGRWRAATAPGRRTSPSLERKLPLLIGTLLLGLLLFLLTLVVWTLSPGG